jgi:hypothetical protein
MPQHSEWTVDTLKEYVDKLREADQLATTTALASADRAVVAALAAAEKASAKSENAADDRFKATNEFRAQLADQTNTFIPRSEADVKLEALSDRLTVLKERLDLNQGSDAGTSDSRRNRLAAQAVIISALLLLVAILGVYAALKP